MTNPIVVFEYSGRSDIKAIRRYLKEGSCVYIIEPVHAYHHREVPRFFPVPLPADVRVLIDSGAILLIKRSTITGRGFFLSSCGSAIEMLDSVMEKFMTIHDRAIGILAGVLGDTLTKAVFKRYLCDRLAEYRSLQGMMKGLDEYFEHSSFVFYPDMNLEKYKEMESLCVPETTFDNITLMSTQKVKGATPKLVLFLGLCAQALVSVIWRPFPPKHVKRKYKYAVNIHAPKRQLVDNMRGPDFIVDDRMIQKDQVCYIASVPLDPDQTRRLEALGSDVYALPSPGKVFAYPALWFHLAYLCFDKSMTYEELRLDSVMLYTVSAWKALLSKIEIQHFITHCDYSNSHIARNHVLHESGAQTWFYLDSINTVFNFANQECPEPRLPLRTYMYYAHVVCWHKAYERYILSHPNLIGKTHVVGCLWASQLDQVEMLDLKRGDEKLIAVYPSTYTTYGLMSYREGVAFARDIKRLAEEIEGIRVVVKVKKENAFHERVAGKDGKELAELYESMAGHAKIEMLGDSGDASALMACADLCVSFPFTSTTFEALSAGIASVWHDPLDMYTETPYGKMGVVMTEGYDELKDIVGKVKEGTFYQPLPDNDPFLDPYRDGKAVERFIKLLGA